jgi:hypothetical protein
MKESFVVKLLIHTLKLPYYAVKGIIYLVNRSKEVKADIQKKKKSRAKAKILPKYQEFRNLHSYQGELSKWETKIQDSDSTIGIILGARGTGKSAFGIKFLENMHSKTKKKCFAMGFSKEEMPSWIKVIESPEELKNDSHVLIDEGGILFSSRKSMSSANKLLSDLILIARHKNLSIMFISQNSANLDVNILRQADYLVLKPSSLLQKDFERKKIQKIYSEVEEDFKKYKEDKGLGYVYADNFRGFISNPLPSFWNTNISKSFS